VPKVLIVTPSAYLHGGVETVIHDLCAELPRLGWSAELGLAAGRRFHIVSRYRAAYPDVVQHPIIPRFSTRGARVNAIMSVIRAVAPDVVVAARIADTYEAVARLKLADGGPRLGVAVRGFEAQYVQDVSVYRNFIDACFVDGKLIQRACVELGGIDSDRVHSLPGGVRAPLLPAKPKVSGKVLRIGYVGRLAQADKRVLDLIPLVHRLHELGLRFSVDVAGTGPDEDALKRALGPWQERIRFHGWLTREELYERIFPNIDCVLNFSPTEGVTIAPREALIHGVVCVLSRFPGLQLEGLFVHGHNALTFPTGDIKMAAQHLISLQREPGVLEWLSTNALQAQTGKYTFQGAADAWAEALDRCLAMPAKVDPNFKLMADPAGRLEAWGLPRAIADLVRWCLGREAIPLDPGSEWPHGRVPVPLGEQGRLESWAAGLESQCKYQDTPVAHVT
jgi:glycosyltransferase involved in cell wall biosynthesis